jgi:hypothetical protein
MAIVERRLSALIASTLVNGFQCPLFPLVLAEANASGMVSNQNHRLSNSRKPREIPFG